MDLMRPENQEEILEKNHPKVTLVQIIKEMMNRAMRTA